MLGIKLNDKLGFSLQKKKVKKYNWYHHNKTTEAESRDWQFAVNVREKECERANRTRGAPLTDTY